MRKKFKDIMQIKNGRNQKNVENGKGQFPIYGSGGVIGYADDYICEADTIVIGRKGSINNPIFVDTPFWNVDTAFGLVPNKDFVLPKYLFYFCKKFNFEKLNTTVTIPSLTKENLFNIEIEIPELEKQRSIVNILDKVCKIIADRKCELEELDILVRARFVEMFGNPVNNPSGWKKCHLKDCLESVDNGKSFICSNIPRTGTAPAILKLSAVTQGIYKPTENKAIIDGNDFVEDAEVHNNDLLFTRKNTPELVGMSAYVSVTPEKLMMPDLIFRLNTKKNCHKVFLWQLINHDLFRGQIQNLASGSAKSMSNISKEKLGMLVIVLPPLKLQNQFAAFVARTDKSKF